MKKIGLITIQRWWNYGSMLQAYAEFTKLNSMGYDCEFIDFMPAKLFNVRSYRMYSDDPEYVGIRDRYIEEMGGRKARFREFEKKFKISIDTYGCDNDLEKNPPEYDAYITGGDQIWNVNMRIASKAFFLHFTDSKEKYAFSTSMGKCTAEKLIDYKDYIKGYKKIYMREQSGDEKIMSLIGEDCDIEIDTMIDPTLQLAAEEWRKLIPKDKLFDKKYIACYATLDDELREMYPFLKRIHECLNLPVVLFGMVSPVDEDWIINKVDAGPVEFLRIIDGADFVFTQSFHGTVFSCLFHKNFLTFNVDPKEPRKNEILSRFGLSTRIINKECDFKDLSFEYPLFDATDRCLKNERLKAEKVIADCLGGQYGRQG